MAYFVWMVLVALGFEYPWNIVIFVLVSTPVCYPMLIWAYFYHCLSVGKPVGIRKGELRLLSMISILYVLPPIYGGGAMMLLYLPVILVCLSSYVYVGHKVMKGSLLHIEDRVVVRDIKHLYLWLLLLGCFYLFLFCGLLFAIDWFNHPFG